MKVAQTKGICFNSDICAVDQKQIHFFSEIYDKSGIIPDPCQVDEIKKLPSSTNITDLQKVLGISTYMAPFILHQFDLTAPMRNLLKKESEYKWTTNQ